jgi:hypothetical protein
MVRISGEEEEKVDGGEQGRQEEDMSDLRYLPTGQDSERTSYK